MTLDETLIACVKLAANLPDLDVRIVNRGDAWRADEASVTIRKSGIVPSGVDEKRLTSEDDYLRETIHGVRVVRVELVFDTYSHESNQSAEDLADYVIGGFHRTEIGDLLDAVSLARPAFGDVRSVPARSTNSDLRSVAIVEARFNASRIVKGGLFDPIESIVPVVVLSS